MQYNRIIVDLRLNCGKDPTKKKETANLAERDEKSFPIHEKITKQPKQQIEEFKL